MPLIRGYYFTGNRGGWGPRLSAGRFSSESRLAGRAAAESCQTSADQLRELYVDSAGRGRMSDPLEIDHERREALNGNARRALDLYDAAPALRY